MAKTKKVPDPQFDLPPLNAQEKLEQLQFDPLTEYVETLQKRRKELTVLEYLAACEKLIGYIHPKLKSIDHTICQDFSSLTVPVDDQGNLLPMETEAIVNGTTVDLDPQKA